MNLLLEGATNAQRATHKEDKKKDFKTLFLIHQCEDDDNFEKVGACESSKQAWKILEKTYEGDDKAKLVWLQTHKPQLEFIQMEEKETINEKKRRQSSKNADEKDVDLTQCRRLIGSLRYLCNM